MEQSSAEWASSRDIKEARAEALTMRLIEQFGARAYRFPWQFSDEEIGVIAGWGGMDDKATFTEGDERLIAAYDLNTELGENTYPKFAVVLRRRKEQWENNNRAAANRLHGEQLLEAAVDACVAAGMSKRTITQKMNEYCEWNGL
jgi:hypothetical protein